ncbi:MAG: electron transport complex subunit RsxG [Pseudomonadales bacterium]
MIGQAISRNSLLLGVFAVVATGVIAATHLGTKDRIAEQIRAARERALLEIVPARRHNNAMLDTTLPITDSDLLNLAAEGKIFIALQDANPVAFVFPSVAPDGYSGAIELLVGVNADGSIAGVRTVQHEETPGLGDKVDLRKSDWILGFNSRSLGDPEPARWKVTKDKGVFNQFTGATITPRAVTKAVYQTLEYYRLHNEELLAHARTAITAVEKTNDGE